MNKSDKNTLKILEFLKAKGEIKFDVDFCEAIGLQKQNLIKIKNQDQNKAGNHFTTEQLTLVAEIFNVNMNFIFGVSSEPFRNNTSTIKSTLKNKTKEKTEKQLN